MIRELKNRYAWLIPVATHKGPSKVYAWHEHKEREQKATG